MTDPINSIKKRKKIPWNKVTKWSIATTLIIFILLISFLSISTNVTSNTGQYVYGLPFEPGTKHRIIQGYGGLFSHLNIAALDFSMPEGTPICAARDGIVYSYKDDSNEGGPFASYKNKANYIIIQHSDGSYGCYWHLKYRGVIVKKGSVLKGQIIGYSGSTGFVFSPHLHFSVKRKLGYEKDFYVKTRFLTSSGTKFLSMWGVYECPMQ